MEKTVTELIPVGEICVSLSLCAYSWRTGYVNDLSYMEYMASQNVGKEDSTACNPRRQSQCWQRHCWHRRIGNGSVVTGQSRNSSHREPGIQHQKQVSSTIFQACLNKCIKQQWRWIFQNEITREFFTSTKQPVHLAFYLVAYVVFPLSSQ